MKTAFEYAKECVGVSEWANGSNPEVEKMFAEAGHPGQLDSVPWCAAFVGAMLARAGIKGTGKLNARSYLDWGTPVDRKDAKPGDVVIFKRGNSSWQGHVAFFVKDRGALIDVLGGNQSNAVNVKGYQAAALLGIRRAPHVSKPAAPVTRPAPHVSKTPKREHDAPSQAPHDPADGAQMLGKVILAALALWAATATAWLTDTLGAIADFIIFWQ